MLRSTWWFAKLKRLRWGERGREFEHQSWLQPRFGIKMSSGKVVSFQVESSHHEAYCQHHLEAVECTLLSI